VPRNHRRHRGGERIGHTKLQPAERRALGKAVRARLDGGATLHGLVREFGRSRPTLTRALRSVGGRPRTNAEDMQRRYATMSAEDRRRIAEPAFATARARVAAGEWPLQHRNATKYPGYHADNERARRVAYAEVGMLRVCHHCGTPWNIEVHHLNGRQWVNDADNLLPLCAECHNALHAFAYHQAGLYKASRLARAWWPFQEDSPAMPAPRLQHDVPPRATLPEDEDDDGGASA
jgi:hypothetical protein